MNLPMFRERPAERDIKAQISENENARFEKTVRERDHQAQIDWDKLLELAFNAPGQIVSVARQHAPEATARVGSPSSTAARV